MKHRWQVSALFFGLLALLVLAPKQVLANSSGLATNGYLSYSNVYYGFSIEYPGSWRVLTSVLNLPTFLSPGQNSACQVDVHVDNRSGTVQSVLSETVPPDAMNVVQTTHMGLSAAMYHEELRPSPSAPGKIDASVDTVLVAKSGTNGSVTLYSLTHTVYRMRATSAVSEQCSTQFNTMVSSFSVSSPSVSLTSNTTGVSLTATTASSAVQYAEAWWNYNKGDGTAGRYCASVYFDANGEECNPPQYVAVTQPGGYYQPDFQCAEFVSRALAAAGLIPGLSSSSAQSSFGSYTYTNGKTYDLNYVPDLYSFLMDSGIGTPIGDNPTGASPGDVVIYTDSSGVQAHTTLIVVTGSSTLVDSHNAAGYHWVYNSFSGMSVNIIHISGGSSGSGSSTLASNSSPVVCEASGAFVAFTLGNDNNVQDIYQTSSTTWSSWGEPAGSPPVPMTGTPQAIILSGGAIAVFVRGSDGNIWDFYQQSDGTWSGWGKPEANTITAVSDPSVVRTSSGGLVVFATGSDGNVWDFYQKSDGTWSGWGTPAGAPPVSMAGSPAARIMSSGAIVVFVRGSDGNIWDFYQQSDGTWSGWGKPEANTITAVSDPDPIVSSGGGLVVFATGSDGNVWDFYQQSDGTWSGWGTPAGAPPVQMIGTPSALMSMATFATGSDGNVWDFYQQSDGTWSGWGAPGGTPPVSMAGSPVALTTTGGLIAVFVKGSNAQLYETYQNADGTWQSFVSLGGSIQSV